ncbi:MAG: metal-dependent hydrolase [Acidobacteria bacterium]|nr:metal-dependent hydrolase [Acidobacteriota bacterium]
MTGAVLSRAGFRQRTRLATPALLVAANLPDIEVFGSPFGFNYLESHRGITHSLVGSALLATGLAGCLYLVDRLSRRGAVSRSSFRALWVVCLAGIFSHVALDFLNDYGIRPWLPFSGAWVYGDLLSIVDPWLWIILGSALYVGTRSPAGRLGWLVLGCMMFAAVCLGRNLSAGIAWLVILAALLAAGLALRRRGYNPAVAALLLLALYLGGVVVMRENVARVVRSRATALVSGSPVKIDVLPGRPNQDRSWTVVAEAPGKYYISEVRLRDWRLELPGFEAFEKNLDDLCYLASLSQEQMAVMARFARYPSVAVEPSANGCRVWLRDLRYARRNEPGWGVAHATVALTGPRPVQSR